MSDTVSADIARLNDQLRRTFTGGKVMMTRGVAALPETTTAAALTMLRSFDAFTEDNDPHGEHDFGAFSVDGHRFFFKIDCYDLSMECASEDPANPGVTVRVLTLMLASEY